MPEVNWIAILVGTGAAFMVGFLWYGKLFRTPWMLGSGLTEEDGQSVPVFALGAQLVGLFLLALVIGVTETTGALATAFLAILAAATLVVSGGAFSKKSPAAVGIEGGYVLVCGVLMILAQAAF